MMDAYPNPEDIRPLMEREDYLGWSALEIVSRSSVHKVLDTKILDRLIKEKWNGITVETHNILNWSSGCWLY